MSRTAVIKLWGLAHTLVTFFLAAVPGEGERLGEEVSLASGDGTDPGTPGEQPAPLTRSAAPRNKYMETSHPPLTF